MAIELTCGMPRQSTQQFSSAQIPKFDGLVPTTTGEGLTIRATTDLTRLECPDRVRSSFPVQIPKFDRLVLTTTSKSLTIGTDSDGPNRV